MLSQTLTCKKSSKVVFQLLFHLSPFTTITPYSGFNYKCTVLIYSLIITSICAYVNHTSKPLTFRKDFLCDTKLAVQVFKILKMISLWAQCNIWREKYGFHSCYFLLSFNHDEFSLSLDYLKGRVLYSQHKNNIKTLLK